MVNIRTAYSFHYKIQIEILEKNIIQIASRSKMIECMNVSVLEKMERVSRIFFFLLFSLYLFVLIWAEIQKNLI